MSSRLPGAGMRNCRSGVTGEDTEIIIIIMSLMLGYLTPLAEAPTNIEQYNNIYNKILNQDSSILCCINSYRSKIALDGYGYGKKEKLENLIFKKINAPVSNIICRLFVGIDRKYYYIIIIIISVMFGRNGWIS